MKDGEICRSCCGRGVDAQSLPLRECPTCHGYGYYRSGRYVLITLALAFIGTAWIIYRAVEGFMSH